MIKDAQEQAVSGATMETVARFDQAVRAYNSGFGDALGLCDAVLEASPGFVMAHVTKAWMFALANDPGLAGMLDARLPVHRRPIRPMRSIIVHAPLVRPRGPGAFDLR